VLGLLLTDTLCRKIAPLAQVRRALAQVMRVACEDMYASFINHPLGPVLRISAESTSKGSSSDLHPDAGSNQPLNRLIGCLDPRKPFRMSQYWNIARDHQIEEQVFQTGRDNVMRWLNQHITCVG
jgi:hypothetical protein